VLEGRNVRAQQSVSDCLEFDQWVALLWSSGWLERWCTARLVSNDFVEADRVTCLWTRCCWLTMLMTQQDRDADGSETSHSTA
jgi:hypothetical protein